MFKINPYTQNSIFFRGFKQDLTLARFVVNDIQQLNTVSDTAIELQINKKKAVLKKGDQQGLNEINQLEALKQTIAKKIDMIRDSLNGKYNTFLKYTDALKKKVVKYKVANCGELAALVQAELVKAGRTANLAIMCVRDKMTGEINPDKEHEFVVLNIQDDGLIEDPDSWGENAIVVDPWSGIVEKANNGLYEIMKLFNVDLTKEDVAFEEADMVNMDDNEQVGF